MIEGSLDKIVSFLDLVLNQWTIVMCGSHPFLPLPALFFFLFQDTLTVADPETRKPCKRQVFLFEQLMIFSEPFERKLDWTVYIYRHSIKV